MITSRRLVTAVTMLLAMPALLALSFLFWFQVPQVHAQGAPDSLAWTCSLDDIGATLTRCLSNNDPSKSVYLTDVVATSTTATAGLLILRYGTGSNCGTGTASLLPSAATVPRIPYPANTAAPTTLQFLQALKVPPANDLCVLGVVTNTVSIQLGGYIR